MAWLEKRAKGSYRVGWRTPDGKVHKSRRFARRTDADAYRRTIDGDAVKGLFHDASRGRVTLRELWAEVRARDEGRLRPSTLSGYDIIWRLYLGPALGDRRLANITRPDVEAFIARMQAHATGAATIAGVYKFLRRLLNEAVKSERIYRNVALGVELPRNQRPTPERALTAEEVWLLARKVPERSRAAILVMGFCGLRIGEIAGLRVDRVDFLRRVIRVEEQLTEVGGQLHRGPTKTGSKRAVDAPAFVLEELSEHIRKFPPIEDGTVFYGPDGGPLRRNSWRQRVFAPAVRKAGLEPLRPHDLRHTAISIALGAGAPLKVVQAIAGHASAAMTADRYGHMMPGIGAQVATKIDEIGRAAAGGEAREA